MLHKFAQQKSFSQAPPARPHLQGIGGWLAFYCICQLIINPLVNIPHLLNGPFSAWKVLGFALVAFSFVTGTMIVLLHPKTIQVLSAYFVTAIAIQLGAIIVVSKSVDTAGGILFINNRLFNLMFVLGWAAYFFFSERVRINFGRNLL
jgi:hypothetical protein